MAKVRDNKVKQPEKNRQKLNNLSLEREWHFGSLFTTDDEMHDDIYDQADNPTEMYITIITARENAG